MIDGNDVYVLFQKTDINFTEKSTFANECNLFLIKRPQSAIDKYSLQEVPNTRTISLTLAHEKRGEKRKRRKRNQKDKIANNKAAYDQTYQLYRVLFELE